MTAMTLSHHSTSTRQAEPQGQRLGGSTGAIATAGRPQAGTQLTPEGGHDAGATGHTAFSSGRNMSGSCVRCNCGQAHASVLNLLSWCFKEMTSSSPSSCIVCQTVRCSFRRSNVAVFCVPSMPASHCQWAAAALDPSQSFPPPLGSRHYPWRGLHLLARALPRMYPAPGAGSGTSAATP